MNPDTPPATVPPPPVEQVDADVARALIEDIGSGDVTASLLPDGDDVAYLLCKEDAVVCGRPWFDTCHRALDQGVRIDWRVHEGERVSAGTVLATLAGRSRALVTAERTALNFLQTLSGTATLAQYATALNSITYYNGSQSPTGGTRTVTFQVDDGQSAAYLSGEVSTVITVTPVNDAPTTANNTVFAATGNGASYTFSLAEFAFSDLDSGFSGVVITTLPGSANILVNGTIVTAGTFVDAATIAAGGLTYANTNGNSTARTFTFQVRDDSGSATNTSTAATMTVTLGTAGTRPTWTNTISAKSYTENSSTPVALVDSTVALSAATYTTARLTVTSGWIAAEDQLSFTANTTTMGAGAITVTNSGGVITLSRATASPPPRWPRPSRRSSSNSSDSPNTGSRAFTVQALANTASSNWSLGLSGTVGVTPQNDTPSLASPAATLSYTAGAAAAINPWIRVADLDGGLADAVAGNDATATITLTNAQSGDTLGFTANAGTMGNIALTSNAGGVLTLTSAGGTATAAQWEAALRAVTFLNASASNTTVRSVDFEVSDGTATSTALTTSISMGSSTSSAPVLAVSDTLDYSENDPAAAIDALLTVSDGDSTNLVGATVRITNFVAGEDVLSFTDQGSITGSFDSNTGILTLTGTATVADYQAALRLVKYSNTSEQPDTTTRTVAYQVDDGSAQDNLSNVLTASITVAAVNDAPALSVPSAITFNDDATAQSFFAVTGTLTTTDADGGTATYSLAGSSAAGPGAPDGYDLELAGSYGTLYLNSQTGAYAYVPDSAAINAVAEGSTPSESFTLGVSDGSATDSQTLTVNVVGANDTPILSSSSTVITYVENAAATPVNTVLQVADADSATLSSATVWITGNYQAGEDVLSFTIAARSCSATSPPASTPSPAN